MKRFAVLAAAVAIAILAVSATSTAQSPAGVMYRFDQAPECVKIEPLIEGKEIDGPPEGYEIDIPSEGVLTVVNAMGRHMKVLDSDDNLVFHGKIPEDHFECMVPNAGTDHDGAILRVWLGGPAFLIIDKDEDWIWE